MNGFQSFQSILTFVKVLPLLPNVCQFTEYTELPTHKADGNNLHSPEGSGAMTCGGSGEKNDASLACELTEEVRDRVICSCI